MGLLKKFMEIIKLEDEEEIDDEYYDDGFDDESDKKKKTLFKKQRETLNFDDEKYTHASTPKVTPMRPVASKRTNMEVCVIKPTTVEDAREIVETLLSGSTVILNFEGLDLEVAQRIIDFTSGATFSIDGNLQKISKYIFLVTPTSVGISGDLQDLLNSSFDVPTMKTHF